MTKQLAFQLPSKSLCEGTQQRLEQEKQEAMNSQRAISKEYNIQSSVMVSNEESDVTKSNPTMKT